MLSTIFVFLSSGDDLVLESTMFKCHHSSHHHHHHPHVNHHNFITGQSKFEIVRGTLCEPNGWLCALLNCPIWFSGIPLPSLSSPHHHHHRNHHHRCWNRYCKVSLSQCRELIISPTKPRLPCEMLGMLDAKCDALPGFLSTNPPPRIEQLLGWQLYHSVASESISTKPCPVSFTSVCLLTTLVKTLAGLQWKHNRRSQLQRTLMMPRCCLLWYKHGLIKMLTLRHLSNGYCLEVTIRLLEARQATSPQLPQALSSPVNASHYTEHPMLLLPHSTHYNADNIFIATDYIG